MRKIDRTGEKAINNFGSGSYNEIMWIIKE